MTERRRGMSISAQLVNVGPLLLLWSAGLGVLFVAGMQRAVPLDELFLDANYVAGVPWYTGLLSNLGILGWSVGACAAAAGAWLAAKLDRRSAAYFLASGSVLTVWLLADDLFELHAALLPSLGLSPTGAMLVVAAPAVVWASMSGGEILRTRWLLFGAAMVGFAVSLGADELLTSPVPTEGQLLVEDGAKLLGIMAWSQYFVLTALDIARSVIAEATARAGVGAPELISTQR